MNLYQAEVESGQPGLEAITPQSPLCTYVAVCTYEAVGITPTKYGWKRVCFFHSERDNLEVKPLGWQG